MITGQRSKDATRVHQRYQKRANWYIGYVEELPSVNTQGKTLKEVRENLEEALRLIIEANRELASKSPSNTPSKDSSLRSE